MCSNFAHHLLHIHLRFTSMIEVALMLCSARYCRYSRFSSPFFSQVLLNILALLGLRALGVVPLNPFSLRLAERLMVPAVCGSVQCVLAMWARASAHSGLFPVIGRLLPLFSLAWGHLLGVSKPNSAHFTCLLTAITLTSIGITGRRTAINTYDNGA